MTSAVRRREQDDSGEYSDGSQDIDHNNSLNDGVQQESDYDSQGSESERSDRDPDSQETERRVDDDEDRSNPQYIPKRGTFYEHDDRTAACGEESSNTTSEVSSDKKEGVEAPAERRRPPRKSDIINKWSHDKYNENEQVPKSRDELVAIYGYDIRNEDAPPHARRNRRYGRGPNKYTRTWEDEEAYRRQSAAQAQPRKPPNPEDFPELEAAAKKHGKKPRTPPRPRSKSQPASNESSEKSVQLRRNASIKTPKPKPVAKPALNKTAPVKNTPKTTKEKMPALENLTITATVNNNSQGHPQRRVTQGWPKPITVPTQPQQQGNPPPNKAPTQPQQPPQQQQKPQPNQQQQQQQAGAEPRGGSKRYSSQRHRPLAEPYTPQQQQLQNLQNQQKQQSNQQKQQSNQQQQPQQQQQQQQTQQQPPHRYIAGPSEYASTNQHQATPAAHPHPQHMLHQQVLRPPAVAHAPSPPHQPPHSAQQVRLGLLEQPPLVSHAHHNLHNMPNMPNMPAHNIGQLQPSQAYAPPAMMPAQYMQGGSGAVICPAAMYGQPPAPPYQHQIYPHHNYATQAGGVTYYNCAEQEPPQQPRTQRRPTAAIPIVRPQAPERPANSSEKDNIDRIVENMFVRKPWPAAHGTDKEKSEPRSSQEPQSKESSQPDSLTSSSISIDSKPSEVKEEKEEEKEKEPHQENVTTDA
ncbi:hypothetical protein K1T71_013120 [Dendrolimus kikuchii]|uniref:Uncharacterized protein n=1 Tax=Dendrolimus kikuchii TaxID=765133 RepID=A0ACC1CJ43_9NEOP|nr:hypothetical protein K1T71_013120 [Dendrolimus kikuchii]